MPVSPEEEALAASALAEGLQADAPIGFAVLDEELRYLLVSHSLAAMNRRPPEDHFGRRVAEILPPGLAAAVRSMLVEVRDTGVARTGVEIDDSTHAEQGGDRRWVAGYYPITLAGRRLVGVVLVDVTERRRAQDALRESEAELSGAQRLAGVGWWTWTTEPETVVYAPELLDHMGRDPALGGTPQSRDQLVLADGELASVREAAMASLAGGGPFARRVRALHADGGMRLLEARADVVRDASGRAVGLQGFVQDVTELARAEQRQRALAELGQRALEEPDLDTLLQHTVDVVGREIGVDGVAVLEALPGGDQARIRAVSFRRPAPAAVIPVVRGGIVARALATRAPVLAADLLTDEDLVISPEERRAGARSVVITAIDGRTGPFGVLGTMSGQPDHFGEEDTAFLTATANVLAGAVERRAAQEEIAAIGAARGRLVAQAIDAENRARRSTSEALHDGALQELLAARNELFAMAGRGGDDAALEAARDRLTAIVARLRDVMGALHPTVLQYGGLEAALEAVADQERGTGDLNVQVTVDQEACGARDELVLSLARELLANAARHAGGSWVAVAVRREPGEIVLSVADDGSGIASGRLEAALEHGAIGLASCRERVEALGGSLLLRSPADGGTHALARIPHPADADPQGAGIYRMENHGHGA